MSDNLNEKKFVTLEMFEKYHERLMNYIVNGDGITLEDLIEEDIEAEEQTNI